MSDKITEAPQLTSLPFFLFPFVSQFPLHISNPRRKRHAAGRQGRRPVQRPDGAAVRQGRSKAVQDVAPAGSRSILPTPPPPPPPTSGEERGGHNECEEEKYMFHSLQVTTTNWEFVVPVTSGRAGESPSELRRTHTPNEVSETPRHSGHD